jgi:hypothetical protein
MLWTTISIFMLRMPIFEHELAAKKRVLLVEFVSATLNLNLDLDLDPKTRLCRAKIAPIQALHV